MSEQHSDLVALGLVAADAIEQSRLVNAAGVVRRLCAALTESGAAPPDTNSSDDLCPMCGAPLVHRTGGRRRRFCSDRCRSRARFRAIRHD